MAEKGGIEIHPMDQFIVKPLFGGESVQVFTITNVTLWLALTVLVIAIIFVVGSRSRAVVPSRFQSVGELMYGFSRSMVEDNAGKDAMAFFPLVMTIFMFVLFSNLLGLIPYSFTTTSHVAVTATLAVAIFLLVTITGFVKNGAGFLKLFWVSSAPLALRPILAVIELISYFARPVSHSIRLAGNMMAGHAVIKVFAGFAGVLGFGAILPVVSISAIYGLELLVAVVQAYVFAILTCVYLHDAFHPGH